VRGILDGHVWLSRSLAGKGHYPAIDILGSVSRLRNDVLTAEELAAAARLTRWLKTLEDNRDLVNIGAYAAGSDPLLDEALARREEIRTFLTQSTGESATMADSLAQLTSLAGEA